MRYIDNPDDPYRPFIDVTPAELDRHRWRIVRMLRSGRFRLQRADREDIAQEVMIQAWFALTRGVRGCFLGADRLAEQHKLEAIGCADCQDAPGACGLARLLRPSA